MNKKNNQLSTTNYLKCYDLINKYNITSLYEQPEIKSLHIKMFLKEFLEASDFANKQKPKDSIKMKTMIFFYILFNNFPKVIFQSRKTTKNSKIRNDGDFILEFRTTDASKINAFIEKCFKDIEVSSIKNRETAKFKVWSYNLRIPGNTFFEINDLFDTKIQDINLKNTRVDLSFVYVNVPEDTKMEDIIRNLNFL